MRRPSPSLVQLGYCAILWISTAYAIFDDVQISDFEQTGLALSFCVEWETLSEDPPDGAELIDIWILTRQPDPSTWAETALVKSVEDTGNMWVDTGDAWSTTGSWDPSISGEAAICVYNSTNYDDNACGERVGIVPYDEAPYASSGEGISNVDLHRVEQADSKLSFSITWADGGSSDDSDDGTADSVDIWLSAKQDDPQAWVELPVEENLDNSRLAQFEVDMDWSSMGWDEDREGSLSVCVYDSSDYDNMACSTFTTFSDDSSEDSTDENDTGDDNSDSSPHAGATVMGCLLFGGLAIGVTTWLIVAHHRRKERLKLLGSANDAEVLPDDAFIRPPTTQFGRRAGR